MNRRDFLSAAAVSAGAILATGSVNGMPAAKKAEKRGQLYRCKKCDTIVEIVAPGRPSLVHCGEPMELIEELVAPAAENKHVPVITKVPGGVKVLVGSKPHPMTESHYIVWIELVADDKVYRQYLKPGAKPEAVFLLAEKPKKVMAREHCNLHGVWKDK